MFQLKLFYDFSVFEKPRKLIFHPQVSTKNCMLPLKKPLQGPIMGVFGVWGFGCLISSLTQMPLDPERMTPGCNLMFDNV